MYQLPAASLPCKTPLPFVADEMRRQPVPDRYEIPDGAEEAEYDDLAKLAARLCDTPAALIAFFDRDRAFFKARFGIDAREAARALAFCAPALLSPDAVLIVPDLGGDPRFAHCDRMAGGQPVRFCAVAPLVAPFGTLIGTLSVLDHIGRQLTDPQIDALRILARQVVRQLEGGRANAALRLANAKLAEISLTDALTCISNRRAFNQRLAEEEGRAKRTGDPMCLLLIDVDQFKSFNDRFGHLAGDAALFRIADILKTCNRCYDFVARYGGEEFVLILSQTTLDDAAIVAERLRAVVETSDFPCEPLTLSIGVAQYHPERGTAALIAAADGALYAAKAAGRNRVAVAGDPSPRLFDEGSPG